MAGGVTRMFAMTSLMLIAVGIKNNHGAEVRVKRGDEIKVTTIKEPPYLTVDGSGQGNERFKGYIPDLMEKIADKANLDYKMDLVKDGFYGARSSAGSWTGMIGELVRHEADLAAAPITISDERKKVVKFTEPIMTFTTTILIKRPGDGQELKVKNVKELADQTDIKYGLIKAGMTEGFFRKSTNPTYQKMWQFMDSHPENLQTNMADGISRVLNSNGHFAMIIETPTADYWMNKYPCELQKLGDLNNHYSYGLATANNNPALHRKLNEAIVALKNSGELQTLKDKWWKTSKACPNSAPGQGSHSLTYVAVALAAVVQLYLNFRA